MLSDVRQSNISREEIAIDGSLIIEGEALLTLRKLPSESVQCVVTSPPYWGLRDYGIEGQIGLEANLQHYLNHLICVFNEVKRVLKNNGTLWLNIGDGYTSGNRGYRAPDKKNPARAMSIRPDTPDGLKPKDLIGLPWRLAFALQADGWYLRTDVVWHKPNAMPESVKDRPSRAHEFIFLFSKSEKYYYDNKAIYENGRNKRTVWNINTIPFPEAHFATFPAKLIEPCILASTKPNDYVLDPFFGSGTVGFVAQQHDRKYIGIELNPDYIKIASRRINNSMLRIMKVAGE